MGTRLKATLTKKITESIHLEISKENIEAFCDVAGFYQKEFIKTLDRSEKDHKKGRVTKRKLLSELIENS